MKNQRVFTVLLVILLAVLAAGCHMHMVDGNGKIVIEERTVDEGFYAVELTGVGKVDIYPGESYNGREYAVTVTTDSNIQHLVVITSDGSKLCIDEKSRHSFDPTKLAIDVYLPELRSVSLGGVGTVKVNSGSVTNLAISLSGVGEISAQNYQAQTVDVTLSGTGNVKTWAENALTGKLSGIGDILYKGNPAKNVRETGIGKVKRL